MFVIKHKSRLYFHNKGRIILFESQQEANDFINMFVQYSTSMFMQEQRMAEAMQVPIVIMHECEIIPIDFDMDTVECGTVLARELFESMEY